MGDRQRAGRCFGKLSHFFVVLALLDLAATALGCGSEPTGAESAGYELPLRLSPVRIEGPAAAWALFDRDTSTQWSPELDDEGTAQILVTFDRPRVLSQLKVFGPGSGELEVLTEAAERVTRAPVDLSTLHPGWNTIALPDGEPLGTVTLRVVATASVSEVEIWARDGAVRPRLVTERLGEQLAGGHDLTGVLDVREASPASLTLTSGVTASEVRCGAFSFEIGRDPALYRRAWIAYRATGIFRPFALSRSLNGATPSRASWIEGESAAVYYEPVDPSHLRAGTNRYEVCMPSEASGNAYLDRARFLGELDDGAHLASSASIGPVGMAPTRVASQILAPDNNQAQSVQANERLVIAFERFVSPDAIVLVTDQSDWR